MIIHCWGARGSIPVSGPDFIKYGGDTTCLEIRTINDDIVIVDAGTGIRNLGKKLVREERKDCIILFTHSHWDHLIGFPFFAPIYDESSRISIYGCHHEGESVRHIISPTMQPPYFPIPYDDIKAQIAHHDICRDTFKIYDLDVVTVPLSHPNRGLGYRFIEKGKTFVFLTDNELTFKHDGGLDFADYVSFAAGSDLLIHDAEYDRADYAKKKTWGHSVYLDALELAIQARVKNFGLFHHNQDRSDAEIDSMIDVCNNIISERGSPLKCFALYQGMEIEL